MGVGSIGEEEAGLGLCFLVGEVERSGGGMEVEVVEVVEVLEVVEVVVGVKEGGEAKEVIPGGGDSFFT